MQKKTSEDFIKKAIEIHGNKYDYSKVEYKGNKTKVCIICPEHGEFWQTPSNHYKNECPYCAGHKMDTENFIKKASIIHKNKYDYSKTVYVKDKVKVCIICPEHGEFYQDPNSHLNGCGCPECFGVKKLTKDDFITRAKKIHGNKYDYSKVNYNSFNKNVIITCPKHGDFLQKPSNHLDGCGCQKCANESRARIKSDSFENYIKKAKQTHGEKYDYSKVVYKNAKSNAENEIFDYIKSIINLKIIRNARNIIPPQEIDLYIPELKFGIEYNGLLWHSDKFKHESKYHYNKMIECQKRGINLIQIFEDEYVNNKEIVLSKIRHLLLKDNGSKIYARKTKIKEITYKESSVFLEKNHIQGKCSSTVYLGCFYNECLIGVMLFKRIKEKYWRLERYASDIEHICIGVAGKLLNHFLKNYEVETIDTFADRRWTFNEIDNLYVKLGFKFNGYVKPDYSYYIPQKGLFRIHKFNLRKKQMNAKYGFPSSMTEEEMRKKIGAYKIWNCGLIKYTFNL